MFNSILNNGTFSGLTNFFVVEEQKADDLDERADYYSEQLVQLALQLGGAIPVEQYSPTKS